MLWGKINNLKMDVTTVLKELMLVAWRCRCYTIVFIFLLLTDIAKSLEVQVPATVVKLRINDNLNGKAALYAKRGGSVQIPCTVSTTAKTPASVQWTHNGIPLLATSSQSPTTSNPFYSVVYAAGISKDSSPPMPDLTCLNTVLPQIDQNGAISNGNTFSVFTNGSLLITNFTNSHTGCYQCNVSSDGQTILGRVIKVKLKGLPSAIIQPKSLSIVQGYPARFKCNAPEEGHNHYSWFINGKKLPQNNNYVALDTGVLQILQVKSSNISYVRCAVANAFGSVFSRRASLTIHKEDVETLSQSLSVSPTVVAKRQGNTTLDCMFNGLQESVQYEWKRSDGRRLQSKCRKIHGNLHISNVVAKDAGTYICRAKLPSSSTSFVEKRVRLTVNSLYAPEFSKPYEEYTTLFLSTVKLSCKVDGLPTPKVSWYRNGIERLSSGKMLIDEEPSFGSNSFLIRHPQLKDEGYYQCFASNTVGSAVRTMRVNISNRAVCMDTVRSLTVPKDNITSDSVVVRWLHIKDSAINVYFVLRESEKDFKKELREPSRICNQETGWCDFTLFNLKAFTKYRISVHAMARKHTNETTASNTNVPCIESEPVLITTSESIPTRIYGKNDITNRPFGPHRLLLSWPELPLEQRRGRILYYRVVYTPIGQSKNVVTDVAALDVPTQYAMITGLKPNTPYGVNIYPATRAGYPEGDGISLSVNRTHESSPNKCSSELHKFVAEGEISPNGSLTVNWTKPLSVLVQSFLVNVTDRFGYHKNLSAQPNMSSVGFNHLNPLEFYEVSVTVISNETKTCLNATTAVFPGSRSDSTTPYIQSVSSPSWNKLSLNWSYQPTWYADQPILSYVVRCEKSSSSKVTFINSNETFATISGLDALTDYDLSVKVVFKTSVAGRNVTGFSPRWKATTLPQKPTVPRGLNFSVVDHYVTVYWLPPLHAQDEINYIVKYSKTNSSDEWSNPLRKPLYDTSVKLSVDHESQFTVRVRANNSAGQSPYVETHFAFEDEVDESSPVLLIYLVVIGVTVLLCLLAILIICFFKFDLTSCRSCNCCLQALLNLMRKHQERIHVERTPSNNREELGALMKKHDQTATVMNGIVANGAKHDRNGQADRSLGGNGIRTKSNGFVANGIRKLSDRGHHSAADDPDSPLRNQSRDLLLNMTLQRSWKDHTDNMIMVLFNKNRVSRTNSAQSQNTAKDQVLMSVPIPKHSFNGFNGVRSSQGQVSNNTKPPPPSNKKNKYTIDEVGSAAADEGMPTYSDGIDDCVCDEVDHITSISNGKCFHGDSDPSCALLEKRRKNPSPKMPPSLSFDSASPASEFVQEMTTLLDSLC
ncbi:protogenin B-like [Clavelina lepadiformis]|uniref:protogenin B-like n=1 Tax=Clavelina lepadiformis TaxID=159417 RepID=UPI00404392D0